MKKVILTLAVAFGMMITSCASKEQKAIDILKDTTEKIEAAKTIEEYEAAVEEGHKKTDELDMSTEDALKLLDNKEYADAVSELAKVTTKKAAELGASASKKAMDAAGSAADIDMSGFGGSED